jgi:hypothetical protein
MSNSKNPHLVFWMKITAVMAVLLAAHWAVVLMADGRDSLGVYKFSGPPRENLIIGTSRIAQAIRPDVLQRELGAEFLNTGISASATSYSSIYNKTIFQRIDTSTSNGTFILTLDPWILERSIDPLTRELLFTEKGSAMDDLWPCYDEFNLQYFIQDYSYGWGNIWLSHRRDNSTVNGHKDGWVEVTRPLDEKSLATTKALKLESQREEAKWRVYAPDRMQALEELLVFLQKHGKVYFVRLPVAPEFYALENSSLPNYSDLVGALQAKYNVPYFDLQPLHSEVVFNDGHHINKQYSEYITKALADSVRKHAQAGGILR